MNRLRADVTVHIDEPLDRAHRAEMGVGLRTLEGVVNVHNPDARPHLTVVQYNPDRIKSADVLRAVSRKGVHAELIGL